MDICKQSVATPYIDVDDGAGYAVDWRHSAAAAYTHWLLSQPADVVDKAVKAAEAGKFKLAAPGLDGRIVADPYITETARYMLLFAKEIPNANSLCPMPRIAIGWKENSTGRNTRVRLNAMLLAPDCPMATVAAFHNMPVDVIKFYEKVCWNVRDEDCSKIACRAVAMGEAYNNALEIRANTPASTRIMVDADRFGFVVMAIRWGIHQLIIDHNDPNKLQKALEQAGQAEMLHRIAIGTAEGMDLTAMMTQGIEREKLTMEMKAVQSAGGSLEKLAMTLLNMNAPRLLPVVKSERERKSLEASVKAKLQSERQVKAVQIVDNGPTAGFDLMDAQIKKHLNDPRQAPIMAGEPVKTEKNTKKARGK